MSEPDSTSAPATNEPGVLGSLPKTRPQRPSARRQAARSKAARSKAAAKVEPPRAPRQGFEAESEVQPGKTVQPPGSAELAASVVELMGELAQSGLTSTGKLLKDALARLSRS
ncbi:MAG TPA: hypothetical protein VGY76_14270 [Solirubrobacteraceae bacterium]|nr:hypothetical protein [Solirubrobacteraceae bacterium]